MASFKEALHELSPDIPLVLQPGNHDIGQSPTPADIERYRQRFGDDYFEFWVGGVLYIALNSQYYRDDSAVVRERLEQDLLVIEGQVDELLATGKNVHDDQGANFLAGHAQTIRHVLELPHRVYPEAK